MKYTRRQYRGAEDLPLLIEYRRRCTTMENRGEYPGAFDLYELLDPSVETSASLWENSEKQVIAYSGSRKVCDEWITL